MPLTRRSLLQATAAFSAGALSFVSPGRSQQTGARLEESGRADPRLASFDTLMREFVSEHKVPGAALAVTCDRRLVYARGFGLANREKQEAVRPISLFRIASISKPLTAVAVLQLVEQRRLTLETKVWEFLELPQPADSRWKDVTLLHLLQHTGGWDRSVSFDPMFRARRIAGELNIPLPPTPDDIIRYMTLQKLDFDPGSRYAYSNFGYCLLGRVIERAAGTPQEEKAGTKYEKYVRQHVLAPLGIRRTQLGKTLPEGRAPAEVMYYDDKERTGPAVVGQTDESVPAPYGMWSLEAMDAHGGWIASAVDLVRFAAAFDDPQACKILQPKSISTMFAPPTGPAAREADDSPKPVYYGCGWNVRRVREGQINTWHTGALDGTSTLLVRRHDGKNWAVLFNTGGGLATRIDRLIHAAADEVREWPRDDAFAQLL
jgi:N-acyl-D-amino-acid deacylase